MVHVTRNEKGQPTVHVSQELVASGEFERKMRKAVDRVVKDMRPPEFGQAEVKPSEGYELSDEVKAIIVRLVEREARFGHIADYRLAGVLQVGKKPEGKGGLHVLAKAVKAPTLWRDLGQYDVVVWANQMAWQRLSERQREALIAHELSHIGTPNEAGQVVMWEHDIEEFGWVVRTYGQWHSGLEFFAEQLGLGLQGKG